MSREEREKLRRLYERKVLGVGPPTPGDYLILFGIVAVSAGLVILTLFLTGCATEPPKPSCCSQAPIIRQDARTQQEASQAVQAASGQQANSAGASMSCATVWKPLYVAHILFVMGAPNQEFVIFAAPGPPVYGSAVVCQGYFDLQIAGAVVWKTGNTGPYGVWMYPVAVWYTSASWPYDLTIQALVTDPVYSSCTATLTQAIYLTSIPVNN